MAKEEVVVPREDQRARLRELHVSWGSRSCWGLSEEAFRSERRTACGDANSLRRTFLRPGDIFCQHLKGGSELTRGKAC